MITTYSESCIRLARSHKSHVPRNFGLFRQGSLQQINGQVLEAHAVTPYQVFNNLLMISNDSAWNYPAIFFCKVFRGQTHQAAEIRNHKVSVACHNAAGVRIVVRHSFTQETLKNDKISKDPSTIIISNPVFKWLLDTNFALCVCERNVNIAPHPTHVSFPHRQTARTEGRIKWCKYYYYSIKVLMAVYIYIYVILATSWLLHIIAIK